MAKKTHSPASWDMETTAEKNQIETDETTRLVARLSADWQKDHSTNVTKVEEQLLAERPKASAEERLLLRMAAHDAALVEVLGESELQLAKRVRILVDDVATGLTAARTLRQVIACRTATARRVQEVLQTAGVIRGQRRLRETPTLRLVG